MPRVRILAHPELCPQGRDLVVDPGTSLCVALLASGVAIEHACDMVAACATCHVHVREGQAGIPPADDEENDELDNAWGIDAQSRLACCVVVRDTPLVIELPRHTRNHARER